MRLFKTLLSSYTGNLVSEQFYGKSAIMERESGRAGEP